jgi:hypothetical protein
MGNNWKKQHPTEALRHAREKARRRQAWLNEEKARPCSDCGIQYPPECMQFDHVRGDKFKHLAAMQSYSISRLEAEMEKCDLVCANCHAIRTKKRRKT